MRKLPRPWHGATRAQRRRVLDTRANARRTKAPPRAPDAPATACGTAARRGAPPAPKAEVPKRAAHSALLRAPIAPGDTEARLDAATPRRGATPHGATPRAPARGAPARQQAGKATGCRVAIAAAVLRGRDARRARAASSGKRNCASCGACGARVFQGKGQSGKRTRRYSRVMSPATALQARCPTSALFGAMTTAGGGPVLRVFAADELGYVRCAQAAGPDTASVAAMQLVARWGDGTRSRGVERMALTDGNDESVESLLAGASRRDGRAAAAPAAQPAYVRRGRYARSRVRSYTVASAPLRAGPVTEKRR